MRSRFSKHPSRFVDRTRRCRERTFRSATALFRRPLGAGISHLQDIAVLAEKVRSRSPTLPARPADAGSGQNPARRRRRRTPRHPGTRPGPVHLMVDGTR